MVHRPIIMLFSKVGEELINIIDKTKNTPDLIVTHEREPGDYFDRELMSLTDFMSVPQNPSVEDYLYYFNRYENPIITLHDWDKPIPREVCDKHEMYNGIPLLTDFYPELRDEEFREGLVDKDKYEWIGSVIHRVTPEIGRGKIIYSCRRPNTAEDMEEYHSLLKDASLEAWLEFFKPENLKDLRSKGTSNWVTVRWEYHSREKEKYNIAS